ncbi:adenylate kinase family protein [Lysinibacillus xylanilyticus]|uniref:adenylate kinase family protein n=1 Tax=Lysinibacillus xylanilyticus TaxID=582475 RepID=UPI003CFEAE8E
MIDQFPKILLLGAPASGKSTQFTLLKRHYEDIGHFAVRLFFQNEKKKNSHWSKIAIPDKKGWLPDKVVAQAAEEEMIKVKDKGLIVEGFPASAYQADLFNEILIKTGINMDALVYIKVPKEISVARAIKRLVCENCDNGVNHVEPISKDKLICPICLGELTKRADDDILKFQQRLDIHFENIEGIINRINLPKLIIDGTKSKQEVFDSIQDFLKNNYKSGQRI